MEQPGNFPNLRAIYDLARQFGLSEDETWRAMDDVVVSVGQEATVAHYLDELNGALAVRIVTKQRRDLGRDKPASPGRRRGLFGSRQSST